MVCVGMFACHLCACHLHVHVLLEVRRTQLLQGTVTACKWALWPKLHQRQMLSWQHNPHNPAGQKRSCWQARHNPWLLTVLLQGLLGEHYVERLDTLFFYNPPSVFWGLWNTLKAVLPEVTRNKIKVIDPSDIAELLEAVPAEVRRHHTPACWLAGWLVAPQPAAQVWMLGGW